MINSIYTPPYTITSKILKILQNVPKNDPINVPLKIPNQGTDLCKNS